MAVNDGFDKANKATKEINSALIDIVDALTSVGVEISEAIKGAADQLEELNDKAKSAQQIISKTYGQELNKDLKAVVRNAKDLVALNSQAAKGALRQVDIDKRRKKLGDDRAKLEASIELARRNGIPIDKKKIAAIEHYIEEQEQELRNIEDINAEAIAQRGISGAIAENAKSYLDKVDKAGLATALLNKNLSIGTKLAVAGEAAFMAIAKATFEGSDNINKLQKELGISYKSAYNLQNGLALAAADSEKLFITSKKLNESLVELTKQTGLIADFGGETLVTFTTLKNQLGLSGDEAGKLSLLSRIQSENTEQVLDNTVKTVGSLVKQNKVGINVKGVLSDVANVSDAIAVSLGKNPSLIAEAATEARLFGSNLEQVDKIASSLLDFESSIAAELEAELLTGQELNLEKARLLALNNDLAGLSKELADNEEIINAFATGNRIQQEAAAKALGLSRDELAKIALQQEFNNLSAEQFKDTYGEVTYNSLQAQSASEKFAATLEKVQGIIGDIGTVFAPILDGFASLVGFLAESKVGAAALVGVLTTLAGISVAKAIANIFSSAFLAGPIAGPIIAGAAITGLIAAIGTGVAKAQSVSDGIAPAEKGPFTITDAYGAMAVTAKGDSIVASPNVSTGGGSNGMDRSQAGQMIGLLDQLVKKNQTVVLDETKLSVGFSTSGPSYNIGS